jgi:hypothetical protein
MEHEWLRGPIDSADPLATRTRTRRRDGDPAPKLHPVTPLSGRTPPATAKTKRRITRDAAF